MKTFFCLFLALTAAVSMAQAKPSKAAVKFLTRLDSTEAILREFQEKPETAIPAEVLKNARGFVIVNQVKAGAVIGLQEGYASIIVKKADNTWSIPVLLRAGEASLGLQLGASRYEAIYVLMNDDAVRLIFKGRTNLGIDAKAVAGPRVADKEAWNRELLKTPVLVYTKEKGLYAGTTVKTGYLSRNDAINRNYYQVLYDLPELLYGDFVTPPESVNYLRNYVAEITR